MRSTENSHTQNLNLKSIARNRASSAVFQWASDHSVVSLGLALLWVGSATLSSCVPLRCILRQVKILSGLYTSCFLSPFGDSKNWRWDVRKGVLRRGLHLRRFSPPRQNREWKQNKGGRATFSILRFVDYFGTFDPIHLKANCVRPCKSKNNRNPIKLQ